MEMQEPTPLEAVAVTPCHVGALQCHVVVLHELSLDKGQFRVVYSALVTYEEPSRPSKNLLSYRAHCRASAAVVMECRGACMN